MGVIFRLLIIIFKYTNSLILYYILQKIKYYRNPVKESFDVYAGFNDKIIITLSY